MLVTLLMAILAAISIVTTRFEADVFQLFPARSGPLKLLVDTMRWSGSSNEAYFLLEGERGALLSEAERFAGRLRELAIDGQPAFKKVSYRIYEEEDAAPFAAFIGRAVLAPELFLPPEQVNAYLRRLEPSNQAGALKQSVATLASQAGMGMGELLSADPLGLRDMILPRIKRGGQALDLDPSSPYFLSRDGQAMIMIAEPSRPVQDMSFARRLAASINLARQGAKVKISCAGAHVSAAIDESSMKREILACIISSLVVVLALFYMTYRRWLPTILLPIIIIWGVIIALGIAGVLLSSLHIIAFAFMALIIGLGTDYSIHLYDRFHMERSISTERDTALELSCVDTGHGIFTAATTTALPFLCLSFSDVRALAELGLLVGLGVIATMYATFLFLPPLLLFMDRRLSSADYAQLPDFGLGRVWKMTGRHGKLFRWGAFICLAAAILLSRGITFDGELKNLQPRHSEAFLTQEKIERHLAISQKQLLVSIEGTDRDELLQVGGKMDQLASRYLREGKLADYSSLGMLVNSREERQKVDGALRQALAGRDLAEELQRSLEGAGFDSSSFQTYLSGMERLASGSRLTPSEGIELLSSSPLKGVVSRHLHRDDSGYHLLSFLHYRGEEFPLESFLEELHTKVPGARVTSIELVSRQLSDMVKHSFIKGAFLGGILVLFLLFTHFSGIAGVFSSLFPVLAGVASMLGIMATVGMGINFMNAMVLVTILGMGSDYGLHIAHRVGCAEKPVQEELFVQSGRAVLLSALTTIAGFGSLAFADYGALASLGWATNFGIGSTILFSLVALPSFLQRNRSAS